MILAVILLAWLTVVLLQSTCLYPKDFSRGGVWCNGSIHALGACSPSSNLGTPNQKFRVKNAKRCQKNFREGLRILLVAIALGKSVVMDTRTTAPNVFGVNTLITSPAIGQNYVVV